MGLTYNRVYAKRGVATIKLRSNFLHGICFFCLFSLTLLSPSDAFADTGLAPAQMAPVFTAAKDKIIDLFMNSKMVVDDNATKGRGQIEFVDSYKNVSSVSDAPDTSGPLP